MSGKVEILCPNGHWVAVKTSPDTKLLQVLEEACKMQGFHPASDYTLKHGRSLLDVTLSIRYSGIPNLAKLEIVKAAKSRKESNITIALQLPNGNRVQDDFQPDTTIWQVLLHWDRPKDSPYYNQLTRCSEGLHPVCIYMREEVIGQFAMERTTLRSLGLTGGKAMLRLLQRSVDENKLDSIRQKMQTEEERQQRLSERALKLQKEEESSRAAKKRQPEVKESVSSQPGGSSVKETSSKNKAVKPKDNRKPESPKRTGRRSEAVPASASSGPSLEENPPLTPQLEAIAQNLARAINPSMVQQQDTPERAKLREERIKSDPTPTAHKATQPFAQFRFPENTKGQNLYNNERSDPQGVEYLPCDREVVVYKLEDETLRSEEAMETDDIPDDFFEVNESDVRTMWADMQKQVKEMQDTPIMTKAMQLAAKEAKMSKYERVIIRFFFPERIVVQALFRQKETVHSLYQFIKEYLEDKTAAFYLYTTPPKQMLKDNADSLVEADLAPMSVVHFGCQVKKEQYLSAAVKKEFTTEIDAYKILVKYLPNRDGASTSGASDSVAAPSESVRVRNASQAASGKVPKWFKIGKK